MNRPTNRPSAPWPSSPLPNGARCRPGSGGQVADLLFAALSEDPDLILVERAETDKILQEQELYLTGLTHPDQALKLGWMTGARVLVTGSVMASGERVICLAKVIGSETGRVLGKSVKGARDDIPDLAAELADAVGDILDNQRARLIPPEEKTEDRVDRLKKRLAGGKRPTVSIRIAEEHVGRPVIDPAAQTEFQLICRQTGFEVFDPGAGRAVDIRIAGEAFSAFALRRGNLISVKARVEVTATDPRTGRVVAADRATAIAVDLAEHIAAKTALEKAAALVAERMLPLLVAR
jgi:hypothetical protein